MREFTRQILTKSQLDAFVAANGLRLGTNTRVYTPRGIPMGYVESAGKAFWLIVAQEYYEDNGAKVVAWWPELRPAFAIFYEDSAPQVGPPMEPSEVCCDCCGDLITTRPVPVIDEYAHCPKCFAKTKLAFPGSTEPYEVGTA